MKLVAILAGIYFAVLFLTPPAAHTQISGPAQILFQSANGERTAKNLAPLKWSATLAAAALQHAQRMAARNTLSHQLPGEPGMADRASEAGARFHSLTENVAEGPGASSIHQQWMHSPPHRANLLDPQLDSIGIAVAVHDGIMFAVEDFSLAAEKLSLQDQEQIVNAQLRSHGLRILNYTGDARRSCDMDNGYAGTHTPSFIVHYATPDLQTLPDLLAQRIQTGKYHSALAGACASNAKIGISNYRIAVLLFQ